MSLNVWILERSRSVEREGERERERKRGREREGERKREIKSFKSQFTKQINFD
jgi:hypothetical protein